MFKKWFSRRQPIADSYAFLETDMHSHLIPGIDDGSKNTELSLQYIDALQNFGWRGFITTPHIFTDLYPNNQTTIQTAFQPLQQQLPPQIFFRFAAEYMVDLTFTDRIKNESLLCLFDNNVLIEMSYMASSPNIREAVFQMRLKGYLPVLAHPERYLYYHNNLEPLRELKDQGCAFQLNILSLTGYYGINVKRMALRLMAENAYEYAGTDLHHERHADALKKFISDKNFKILSAYPFINNRIR